MRHLKLAIATLTCSALISACSNESEVPAVEQVAPDRPHTFRSVLDGKPRLLTTQLDEQLWVAIDTENGDLFKVWQGQVNFTGTVYDQAHGPQPQSEGQILIESQEQWLHDGQPLEWEYSGHRFEHDQLWLMAEAEVNGQVILLEQNISARVADGKAEITRSFSLSGANGSTLELTNVAAAGETRFSIKEGKSALTQTLELVALNAGEQDAAPQDALPGEALVAGHDCVACHNVTEKTIGPSYLAIARRYPDTEAVVEQLRQKVIDGGAGVWGQAVMTAHPNLEVAIIDDMIRYILSLDDGESSDGEAWSLGEKSIPVPLKAETINIDSDQNGLFVYLHYFSGDQPTPSEMQSEAPAFAGHASQIHLVSDQDFSVEKQKFAYQVLGDLIIEKAGPYTLRLVSDDGAYLSVNGQRVISNWGFHGPEPVDATLDLTAGTHPLEILFFQGTGGAALSLQWFNNDSGQFELIPNSALRVGAEHVREVVAVITDDKIIKSIPGDGQALSGVHPSFNVYQARPESFEPMVGGLDIIDANTLAVSTWDPEGAVYFVENYLSDDPSKIKVSQFANGLAEPLGLKVVDGEIYVLQKQELTKLIDDNNDGIADRYEVVSNDWLVGDNFHEFSFGLEYEDGYFYAALATAILPGGASADPQLPNRGSVMKVAKDSGDIEYIANGLRTPNGIGRGVDGELFIADNQGDWLPSSKIVEVHSGDWFGSRSVDFEGTAGKVEALPVVWLPQDEIGNSPTEPAPLNLGPYQNQMIHGEVTHGGIKRVFAERVNGRLQGAVFRFTQGMEAGVNRIKWANDKNLIVGGIGNPGNWSHDGKLWYGLQRLEYNGETTFEMLSVSARSNGFEIEFTEAIKDGQQINAEDFLIQQWYYEPSPEYGGPKKNVHELTPSRFSLSDDRKRASFELEGLKENHVVYFRIVRPFISASENELWTTEAWYTLNAIPSDNPVSINAEYSVNHNQLNEQEEADGWQLLFDGRSLGGIRNYNSDGLGEKWIVENGSLHLTGKDPGEEGWQTRDGGDIVITKEPVENYEFYLEWKIQENGNSGIIYQVMESPELEYPFLSGPEFQLLHNAGHPDGQIEKHRAGDNYDLISTKFVTVNEPGEWNRARLVVQNGKVQHWLNGYKVVEVDMNSTEWKDLLANSKFKDWSEFGKVRAGHIVLQDHSDKVWFRNIKLKPL